MSPDLRDTINEAFHDAICDGEGRGDAEHLVHHLAKRNLVIVPNSPDLCELLGALRGLLLSIEGDGRETDYSASVKAARAAIAKATQSATPERDVK